MKNLKKNIIKRLHKNTFNFNLLKTAEECNELATVILQRINKGPLKVPDEEIIKEIGDLKLRIIYLEEIYGKEKVNNRVKEKFIQINKYVNNR